MPRRSVAKRRGGGPVTVCERASARQAHAKPGPVLSLNELRLGKSERKPQNLYYVETVRVAKTATFTTKLVKFLHVPAPSPRHLACLFLSVAGDRRFVYVLKSADGDPHFYIGLTSDVRARLSDHNAGRCPHTARYRPWQLHATIELPDEERAVAFERYLKSGSGRAFAKRHFG